MSDHTSAPERIATPADFARELRELREGAGLSVRMLSRRTGLPSGTLGDYLAGRHLPNPNRPEVLVALLDGLLVPAEARDDWRQALLRVRRAPGRRVEGRAPYLGLRAFDVEDADRFFGREQITGLVCQEVRRLRDDDCRLLLLVGASGSGKSSLARAGVAATLRGEGWRVGLTTPSADTIGESAAASDLIVLDQLEEVFALPPAQRVAMTERLGGWVTDEAGPVVVATVRADFLGELIADRRLFSLMLQREVLVPPLSADELRAAVVEPARAGGVEVEPALVDTVVDDLTGEQASGAALPLLSHALLAAWSRLQGTRLTLADFRASGGLAGAVERSAEQAVADLDPAALSALDSVLGQLVHVAESGHPSRRRVALSDLHEMGPGAEEAVESLVRSRILESSDDGVVLSHEVLFTAWRRLADFVRRNQDHLRTRQRLAEAAREWEVLGRDEDLVLRGAALDRAEAFDEAAVLTMTSLERDFVQASSQARRRQQRAATRRRVLGAGVVAAVTVLALVSTSLVVFLGRANGRAEQAGRDALSREVAITAEGLRAKDPSLAAQLALAAYQFSPTEQARSELLSVASDPWRSRVSGVPGSMLALTSPGGDVVITGRADGTAGFYDVSAADRAPREIASATLGGEGESLFAGAFAPDGSVAYLAGMGGRLWRVAPDGGGDPGVVADLGELTVYGLAMSPDGRLLAGALQDGTVRLWDVDGSLSSRLLLGEPGEVAATSVAFSPDGRRLLVVAGSGARIWEIGPRPRVVATLSVVGEGVNTALAGAWSIDDVVALTAQDRRVRLWDVSRISRPRVLSDGLGSFESFVNSVGFSPDGRHMAAAASEGDVVVWETATLREVLTASGSVNYTMVSFLGDRPAIVTGDVEGTLRIWGLNRAAVQAPLGNVFSAIPDGADRRVVAASGGEGTRFLAVYDLTPGERVGDLAARLVTPPELTFNAVTDFSPDGRYVLGGTSVGTVMMWDLDAADGGDLLPISTLSLSEASIDEMNFSADGEWAAGVTADGVSLVRREGDQMRVVRRIDVPGASSADILPGGVDPAAVVVGTAEGAVRIFGLDGTDVGEVGDFETFISSVHVAPEAPTVVIGSVDGSLEVWDMSDPAAPRRVGDRITGARGVPWNASLSTDRRTLVAGGDDAFHVWRRSGDEYRLWARLRDLDGGSSFGARLTSTGQTLAGGGSGSVTLFGIDVDEATQHLCAQRGTPITREEWAVHVPGAAYEDPCTGVDERPDRSNG